MTEMPIANPTVVLREEFDDYALLYNPDALEVFCINPVGVFMWKLFDGKHTTEEILQDLRANCNNVPEDAEAHLREFIVNLANRGLVITETGQVA